MCAPTVNINIAKPTSLRNCTVGSATSTASRPVRPTTTPARTSPITTGTNAPRPTPSSGPAKPASTINASTPKFTVSTYAARGTSQVERPRHAGFASGALHDAHGTRRTDNRDQAPLGKFVARAAPDDLTSSSSRPSPLRAGSFRSRTRNRAALRERPTRGGDPPAKRTLVVHLRSRIASLPGPFTAPAKRLRAEHRRPVLDGDLTDSFVRSDGRAVLYGAPGRRERRPAAREGR
jgi:hypothetical protein